MKVCLEGQIESNIRRVVIKLGTKQITDTEKINFKNIRRLVKEVVWLRSCGVEVVLTVSGAIGMAYTVLFREEDKNKRKHFSIPEKQALAAFGQVKLMELFSNEFLKEGLQIGQVLLTHTIFDQRNSWLNARNTIQAMLKMNLIPVTNENDSVAINEIKFGDNDRLGAMVSLLVDADLYVMLSDIDGFYENYHSEDRKLLEVVKSLSSVLHHAGDSAHHFTSGGMKTKLEAVKMTLKGGIPTIIANGFKEGVLRSVFEGKQEGTLFVPGEKSLHGRKKWIFGRKSRGVLVVDRGAEKALRKHKSLLASGILGLEGRFHQGDPINVMNESGEMIAIGLSNYSGEEIQKIIGKQSSEIGEILGYQNRYDDVIHVDNLVLLKD